MSNTLLPDTTAVVNIAAMDIGVDIAGPTSNTTAASTTRANSTSSADLTNGTLSSTLRACHVIISNAPDFHHEVLESTALRYPLPFSKFKNCTTSKPIIFDFVLYNNWFGKVDLVAGRSKPRYLNESEFWSWNAYFEAYLQNRTLDRIDGTTQAFFNRVLKFSDLSEKDGEVVDAHINASCDVNQMFIRRMIKDDQYYCVLHGACSRCRDIHYQRSCFLTPMWPKEQCTFMTLDLPKFQQVELLDEESQMQGDGHVVTDEGKSIGNHHRPMRICMFGSNRNHTMLARLFSEVPYAKYNAVFYIGSRSINRLSKIYRKNGLDMSRVHMLSEIRYREYYQNVARCHIYLPATDPSEKPSHFPGGLKKLSGSIPQVIAYKLPSVMHQELERLYHEYFTAPVEVYDDTFQSKVQALTRMMERVSSSSDGGIVL